MADPPQERQGVQRDNDFIPPFAAFSGEPLFPPSFPIGTQLTAEMFERQYPIRFQIWQQMRQPITEPSLAAINQSRRSRDWLVMANNLDRYATNHFAGVRRVLKEKQMDTFVKMSQSLEKGEKEGYVQAPTGFGKTVLFGEIVAATALPINLSRLEVASPSTAFTNLRGSILRF